MRASCGAVDEVDDTKNDPVALAERVTLPERERAAGEPDVFAASERRDFQELVAQFRRTDFDHPFSDDPSVRRAGAVEVEEARAAFNAYAQRSPDHAELASMAWDKITDSRKPQEFAVEEKDRRLHAGDMDLALRDPTQHLGPIMEDDRTLARYRAEMPDEEFGGGGAGGNQPPARHGGVPRLYQRAKFLRSRIRRGRTMPSGASWQRRPLM